MKNKTLWIVLAIVAVVVIWGISSYNGLVNKQEGVAKIGRASCRERVLAGV